MTGSLSRAQLVYGWPMVAVHLLQEAGELSEVPQDYAEIFNVAVVAMRDVREGRIEGGLAQDFLHLADMVPRLTAHLAMARVNADELDAASFARLLEETNAYPWPPPLLRVLRATCALAPDLRPALVAYAQTVGAPDPFDFTPDQERANIA